MNFLRIISASIVASAILCVIIFDVIGVQSKTMSNLFIFLTLIYFFAQVQASIYVLSNEKLIAGIKNMSGEFVINAIKSIIASLILAGLIYFLFNPGMSIFLNCFVIGLAHGLISTLTSKSRNSTYWESMVLLLMITFFIDKSLFVLNIELLAVMVIVIAGFSKKCQQCGTWWGQKLIDQIVLKEYKKPKIGSYTKTIRGRGTGRDLGREFEMEVNEYYTYYIITRLYREDYCCEVCRHQTSREVLKEKGLFGWTPILPKQKR